MKQKIDLLFIRETNLYKEDIVITEEKHSQYSKIDIKSIFVIFFNIISKIHCFGEEH